MAEPYFAGQTIDDVMRTVIEAILADGEMTNPSKGPAKELAGVLLEITNPRARLSRTETRGKPFSCLGELCWYLAGSNDLDFIEYYISHYKQYADGNKVFGGYGPRLFNFWGVDQIRSVIDLLGRNRDSRKAVIQLFDARDLVERPEPHDIPCTCTMQYMIRHDRLHMITYMRSNDAYLGLPHDIFSFTMLQEIIACSLSVSLGSYKHAVGSLHLYEKDFAQAERYVQEGWQSTKATMPPMPSGDPWPAIKSLLTAEAQLRAGKSVDDDFLASLDPYWADLIRLLQVFRLWSKKNKKGILEVRDRMRSSVFRPFIDDKLDSLP